MRINSIDNLQDLEKYRVQWSSLLLKEIKLNVLGKIKTSIRGS